MRFVAGDTVRCVVNQYVRRRVQDPRFIPPYALQRLKTPGSYICKLRYSHSILPFQRVMPRQPSGHGCKSSSMRKFLRKRAEQHFSKDKGTAKFSRCCALQQNSKDSKRLVRVRRCGTLWLAVYLYYLLVKSTIFTYYKYTILNDVLERESQI